MMLIVNKHFPPSLWVNAFTTLGSCLLKDFSPLVACVHFLCRKVTEVFPYPVFSYFINTHQFLLPFVLSPLTREGFEGPQDKEAVRVSQPYVDLSLAQLIVSAAHNAVGFSPPLPIPGRNSCHYQWYLTFFSSVFWDIHSLKMGTKKCKWAHSTLYVANIIALPREGKYSICLPVQGPKSLRWGLAEEPSRWTELLCFNTGLEGELWLLFVVGRLEPFLKIHPKL